MEKLDMFDGNYSQVQRVLFWFLARIIFSKKVLYSRSAASVLIKTCRSTSKAATSCNNATLPGIATVIFLCASTCMNIHDSTCFMNSPCWWTFSAAREGIVFLNSLHTKPPECIFCAQTLASSGRTTELWLRSGNHWDHGNDGHVVRDVSDVWPFCRPDPC